MKTGPAYGRNARGGTRNAILGACLSLGLAACGNSSPGPLEGTWVPDGMPKLTTTFRAGEMESLGVIEKVDYKVDGKSVLVTPRDGMLKGTSFRYVLSTPDTAQAMGITYRRVKK
jgi:hypothetical protein